jgi:hypothetical protein
MTTRTPSRPHEEIWELTCDSRVSMEVTNERGGTKDITAQGKGQVLRITTIDREMAEEVVRDAALNPFRNGTLVRVDSGPHQPSPDELSDDDLAAMFDLDNDDFQAVLPNLSELNVRRLKAMTVKADVKHQQVQLLTEYIDDHYRVGGSMPSYDEMQQAYDTKP